MSTQSTGTLSSMIAPPMNELNTEGMEGPFRINPEIPLRNAPDQNTLDGSMLPTITSSELSDIQNFYNRIVYFNNSTLIADGRSVLDWQQADSLPNYSLSYLFGQYLRTQAEQKLDAGVKTDIFKQILVDSGNETTAVTNAIHNNIDPNLSLGEVLTNFRVATALKAPTGVYGFGKDVASFFSVSPKVSTLTSADLKGGGAIVKDISAGSFTVPTVHGDNVTYTGVY